MINYHWSEEEFEYVKGLAAEGLSFSSIAAKATEKFRRKFSRSSVGGMLFRNGIRSKRTGQGPLRQRVVETVKRVREKKPKIAPNADPAMVAILTATDDKPSETSQPILVMRDGKLHANEKLTDTSCRWPIGSPLDRDFCFCGQDTIPLQSYCHEHFRRVYEPVKVRQSVPANDEKVMA